jgi:hypothetical protein
LSYILRNQFKTHQEYLTFGMLSWLIKYAVYDCGDNMAGNCGIVLCGQQRVIGENSTLLHKGIGMANSYLTRVS